MYVSSFICNKVTKDIRELATRRLGSRSPTHYLSWSLLPSIQFHFHFSFLSPLRFSRKHEDHGKPVPLTNPSPSDITLMMGPMDPRLIHSCRFSRSVVSEPAEAVPTEIARPSFADGVACGFGMVFVFRFGFPLVAVAVL